MDIWDKMEKATVSRGNGAYVLPGLYTVVIKAATIFKAREGWDAAAIEMEILESNNPERPVGSTQTQLIKLSNDAGPGNLKQFIAGVMGTSEAEVKAQVGQLVFSDKQPLTGTKAVLEAVPTTTRKGDPFTKCTWRQYTGN